MSRTLRGVLLWVVLLQALPGSAQSCGWERIDRVIAEDSEGIWNPNAYRAALGAMSIGNLGGALWEGSETRLGKTAWQGVDSQIIGGIASEVGKRLFTRTRPYQGGNPCQWHEGKPYDSFPSGETTLATALVTPWVLEYGADNPAAYALLLLPLWVGTARVKNQAHWQSDVIAGWAIGGLSGWFSHSLQTPIMIRLLPDGFEVGFKAQF